MADEKRGRIITPDDPALAEGLKKLSEAYWYIAIADGFGGGIEGQYKAGPALVYVFYRLMEGNRLIEDPEKWRQWVEGAIARFAENFQRHTREALFTAVRESLAEFDTRNSERRKGRQGRKRNFSNRAELLFVVNYFEQELRQAGEPITLSRLAEEIGKGWLKKPSYQYRHLKRAMEDFEVTWSEERGTW